MDLAQHDKVVVFGHSNALGFSTPIFRRRPWAKRLARDLESNVRVVNVSQSGSRVEDWAPGGQFESQLTNELPGTGAVVFQLGEAEALCPPHPTIPAFLSDVQALVSHLQSLGVIDLVWIGPVRIFVEDPIEDAALNSRLDNYDQALANNLQGAAYLRLYPTFLAAQSNNVPPELRPIDRDGEVGVADPWHLTEIGHSLVAEMLFRALPGF